MDNTESYYRDSYQKTQLVHDLQRRNRLHFCFPERVTDSRILSVGSGPGVDIEFLVESNEVHAVDIVEETLDIAKAKGFVTHKVNLDTNPLPFNDDSFDIIIANDILEHLFDPERLLREVYRVLSSTGYAILSVPNHFYWQRRLAILCGEGVVLPCHSASKEWDYFHIRFFTPGGWEQFLNEGNFKIVKKYYDQFVTLPISLPNKLSRKLASKYPGLFALHFVVKVEK